MSHFTVAVFTNSDTQSIEDLLAPYSEEITVAPYVALTKDGIIKRERDRIQSITEHQYAEWKKDSVTYEKDCRNPEHIAFLKGFPQYAKQSDEELYQNTISQYEEGEISSDGGILSTYNPNSKWDWYIVGGRWQGLLILKNSTHGYRGEPGLMTEMTKNYDAAFVSDIDFEAMQKKAGRSFSTYAVVTPDGIWHAPGEMGWWGMSSDSDAEKSQWDTEYQEKFIKPALEKEWYMTIVDCHI